MLDGSFAPSRAGEKVRLRAMKKRVKDEAAGSPSRGDWARDSTFGKLNAGLDRGVEESYAEQEQVTDEWREAPLLFLSLESVSFRCFG